VVCVRLPPAEDVRSISKLARVARSFDGFEPCDLLLVEVAASGQRPATDAIEDLTAKSQTRVAATAGVLLSQMPIATAEHHAFLLDVASNCGYTQGMKTAISIPDHLFNDAERLIARFKTSRSELYSRAIAEFVARHDEDAVTQALDKVVCNVNADPPDTQTSTASALAILRQVEW